MAGQGASGRSHRGRESKVGLEMVQPARRPVEPPPSNMVGTARRQSTCFGGHTRMDTEILILCPSQQVRWPRPLATLLLPSQFCR